MVSSRQAGEVPHVEDLETSTFGELLRQQRTARGWTQEDLAARAGLSVEAIGALERGARQRPHRTTVRLLARALELSEIDEVLFATVARQTAHQTSGDWAAPVSAAGMDAETHTFVMAEIRGYARFIMEQGPVAAAKLAAKFALLMRSGVDVRGGTVLNVRDHEALAVFPSPRHGLLAAADLQTRFAHASTANAPFSLTLGIGAETGKALALEGGYRGPAVNRAIRLCRLAGPGETLTTDGVVRLMHSVDDFEYVNRGSAQLAGCTDLVQIVDAQRSSAPTILSDVDEYAIWPGRLPIGGFLGSLPVGPMVGRDGELRRALTALDGVAGGTGQFVLLTGEAGVGKTRLAQEVTLNVRNNGFLVAAGRCYQPHQTTAYFPFIDALASLFAALPTRLQVESGKRWPYLGQLFPDQIGTYPLASGDSDDQPRLFHAVTGFLREAADWMPLALLLDDLHWADNSSLALVRHLARETRGDRMFLLGTYRDVEIGGGHPLRSVLRDLNREGLTMKIEIRQLEADGTSALIGAVLGADSVSQEFTQLIHRRTEGNPYFIEQLMRAIVERGNIIWQDGAWDLTELEQIDVPESIRSVVEERVSRLSGETRIVLHEASVLGQTFHFDDLEAMSRRSEQDLDDALEEATMVGLVRAMGGDRYIFDHALTHQALYDELSPRRKRNLHRAVGMALAGTSPNRQDTRAPELAHHFFQGRDVPRALLWAMRAGDGAENMFAHGAAEAHYKSALQLAGELDDQSSQAEALERLGRVYRRAARYAEALDTLELAAASYRSRGQIQNEARTVAQIGRVYFDEGLIDEGVRRIRPLLEDLERQDAEIDLDRIVAELAIVLAHLLWRGGRYLESANAAASGAGHARDAGDMVLVAEAEFRRGMASANAGDVGSGFRIIEDALVLAEAVGDLGTASRAVGNLALVYWDRGDTAQARALMSRSLELYRKTNDPTGIADKLLDFAVIDFTLGEWESAHAHLDRADQVLQEVSSSWVRVHHMLRRGELYLAQGRIIEGTCLVEAGLDLAEHEGNMLAECEAACALSEEALVSGNPELARGHLQRFLDRHAVGRDDPEALQTWGWALFARVFAELGDLARAEEYLSRVSDGQVVAQVDTVYTVRAVVAACGGKWDEAEQYAQQALEFARRAGFTVSEARLLYFWGHWLVQKGDTHRAHDRLVEALSIFRRLGALPYMARTEQLLIECREQLPESP